MGGLSRTTHTPSFMDHDQPTPAPAEITTAGRRGLLWWSMLLVAGAATLLSGYLTYAADGADGPVGCGAGSGCAQVLASKWGKWFGLPVSTVSMVLYGGVLWLLLAARTWMPRRSATVWLLMLAAAGAMLGAAAWFMYLQLGVLGAICPWCTVGHALGVLLATLLIVAVLRMNPPKPSITQTSGALLVGALSIILIAVPQTASKERSVIITAISDRPTRDPDNQPGDASPDQQDAAIALFDDVITIDPTTEPAIGPADARHTVVMFMDYACPHCRTAHDLILERGDTRAVLVPIPLNIECNPHAPESMQPRFDEACALNKLALEAHHFGPAVFQEFDRWLLKNDEPPAASAARDHLAGLLASVTAPALAPGQIDRQIQRNVDRYGQLIENRIARRLPIVVHPDSGRRLIGRVHGPEDLQQLIEGSDSP